MTWGQEIFRALLLTFGITEVITNLLHLTSENGLISARKQHGELPKDLTDHQIKLKVILMLCFGAAFFGGALLSYLLHDYLHNTFLVISITFALYAIIEASYYRYRNTIGFALVAIILVICSLLL